MTSFVHETVLLSETVALLLPHSGGKYVDCTVGGAGHSELLLDKSSPDGRLLGLDQDETALLHAEKRLYRFSERAKLMKANFRQVGDVVTEQGFGPVDGILFDLGVSSPQLDVSERGFSYRTDASLDMRMDQTQSTTAADIVNHATETELANIFFRYGEEKFSRRIARAIVEERVREPIMTTERLAELVKKAIPAATRRSGPHPARRVFQALRIAVNDELEALKEALSSGFEVLAPEGRMAVITFHSLEDRIVKTTFAQWAKGCICPPDFPVCRCGRKPVGRLIVKKPILPTEEELLANPRSRSAKLRIVEKC